MSSNSEVISAATKGRARRESLLDRFLRLLSSVRFGLVCLGLLVLACFIGMAIYQQNVDGFETYYATLTNSEKLLYTKLGFFNVYGTWWFQTLLALTSLSIILASIDHFPAAWRYVTRPKRIASIPYLRRQMVKDTIELPGETQEAVADYVAAYLRRKGLKGSVERKGDQVHVFAQRGQLNRLGPYFVHVSLLTMFAGGFVTARFSQIGQMPLSHGDSTRGFVEFVQELEGRRTINHQLPFQVTADRIEQRLIDPAGGLDSSNTLDWRTHLTITDETGTRKAIVYLNHPFDYRGYRFFQSGFDNGGDASDVTLSVADASGQARQVELAKGVPTEVEGVGTLTLVDFAGDFDPQTFGPASDGYDNPVAMIRVRTPNGAENTIPAFNRDMIDAMGGNAPRMPATGMSLALESYAKANRMHFLSVQWDPGATVIYVGSTMLTLALAFVFFVPHQRVWAIVGPVEGGVAKVTLGGNANRLRPGFEKRFKIWTRALVDPASEAEALREDEDDDE